MIERITGTLDRVGETDAAISPPGTGLSYRVLLPAYLAPVLLSQRGREVELHTLQQLDSPNQGSTFVPRLIGFASSQERAFFELFTTVKGVGPKKAMRALTEEPSAVAAAIARRDAAWLTALPEIGKRTAETIVAELHGKVSAIIDTEAMEGSLTEPKGSAMGDGAGQAISALVALGESPIDAERLVRRALSDNPSLSQADEIIEASYRVKS